MLDRMRAGVVLTRDMVEAQFTIGSKQARRMLTPLLKQGLIEYPRTLGLLTSESNLRW
ncbi:MAG: hypothetical protein GX591_04010 [Planctomycetes bacterium]|nr:hypothetical protein [Planctomycetota bacterium]